MNYFYVKTTEKCNSPIYKKVLVDDLLFVKSEGDYVELHTNQGRTLVHLSITKIAEKLPANFYRCQRSYIVNLHKIDSFNKHEISIGDKKVPVSKFEKQDFLTILNVF